MIPVQFQQLHEEGERIYHPGDWAEVNLHTARQWSAHGIAWVPDKYQPQLFAADCGVVTADAKRVRARLNGYEVEVSEGEICLEFAKTLILNPALTVTPARLAVAFDWLDKWHVIAPLLSYDTLACQVGTAEEQADTAAVIRDLRVLLYQPGMVFVRRSADGAAFVDAWRQELGNPYLAFLRALYHVKPLVLALPVCWWSG
jgi:hypothetical protein